MSIPEYTPLPSANPQAPTQTAAPHPQPQYFVPPRPTNVLAIISLISAFVFSAAAVVTGHIALAEIKRTGEPGRGLALAGLIIGYIGVAFLVIFFIIWFGSFFTAMAHMPSAPYSGYGRMN